MCTVGLPTTAVKSCYLQPATPAASHCMKTILYKPRSSENHTSHSKYNWYSTADTADTL